MYLKRKVTQSCVKDIWGQLLKKHCHFFTGLTALLYEDGFVKSDIFGDLRFFTFVLNKNKQDKIKREE